MKKASNILFKISIALQFVLVGTFLLLAILFIFFALPMNTDLIIGALQEGWITSSFQGTTEEVAGQIQMLLMVMGIFFIPYAIVPLISAILCIVAVKKPSKRNYIANIVLGALCGSYLPVLAAIFGLISLSQENKKE